MEKAQASMQKRGSKGDGSIRSIGRNKWRVMVDFGVNPLTKKRERPSRVVNGTKADARKVRDQMKREHEDGLTVEGGRLVFAEFAETWHASRVAAGEVVKTRLERESTMIRDMAAFVGDVRLRDLTPQMVESLYAAIKCDKTERRGSCSGTTLHMYHVLLKQMLRKAVDYDLILRNPCDRVKAPRSDEPERRSLTVDEGARLLGCVDEAEADAYEWLAGKEARQAEWGNLFGRSFLLGLNTISYAMAVRIGLATGMRRGEVFGLCWGSVDLNQPCIKVRQSLTVHGEAKPPKSKAGTRTVAIDATTAAHLRQWKERQAVELLKLGIRQGDDTPVCISTRGGYVEMHNFERWWKAFRERCGFDGLKFHELRHTQATQLLANGVDMKTVQTRLGHSTASLTLNMYAHAIPENDEKAAALVGELFASKPERTPIIEVKTA